MLIGQQIPTSDILLDSRIDDHSNVDGDWNLSEPWIGSTHFTTLNAKHPDKKSSNIQTRSFIARDLVGSVRSSSTKRKSAMGHRETEARQCWTVERHLFSRSARYGVQGNHEQRESRLWNQPRLVRFNTFFAGKPVAKVQTLADQDMHVSSRLMNLQKTA